MAEVDDPVLVITQVLQELENCKNNPTEYATHVNQIISIHQILQADLERTLAGKHKPNHYSEQQSTVSGGSVLVNIYCVFRSDAVLLLRVIPLLNHCSIAPLLLGRYSETLLRLI